MEQQGGANPENRGPEKRPPEMAERGWWDPAVTRLVDDYLPADPAIMLEIGCGLAPAAHALLPARPGLCYLGLDTDADRLAEASRRVAGKDWADRAAFRQGPAAPLPLPDSGIGVVLSAMALHHQPDPGAVLKEAARVLSPGGLVIAVEPDNTNNLFYFNGLLDDVTTAFRDLFREHRRLKAPADTALGPKVAALAEDQGFSIVEVIPYLLGTTRRMTAREFFEGARQIAGIVAQGLPGPGKEVVAATRAVAKAEADAGGPDAVGYACQAVPVFICIARK